MLLLLQQMLLLWLLYGSTAQANDQSFCGGTMSYSFVNVTNSSFKVNITAITCWVLGKGPCGPGCDHSRVGMETRVTRDALQAQTGNRELFGNWSVEYLPPNTDTARYLSLQSGIPDLLGERVEAVNTVQGWEQDASHFLVQVSSDWQYVDVQVSGLSWRPLTYSVGASDPDLVPYLEQVKLKPGMRSDTGRPNSAPMVGFQPVYQVPLDMVTSISLVTADPDGDIVSCRLARFVDAGGLTSLPGITVHENCTLELDTYDLMYKDQGWGAIPIVLSDVSRNDVTMGGVNFVPGGSSFSTVPLQIVFQTVRDLRLPEFLDPTPPNQHELVVYEGALLEIPLYAKPSPASNVDLAQFYVTSTPSIDAAVSPTKYDVTRLADRVAFSQLTWQTQVGDAGVYVIQTGVSDETGVESQGRGYVVQVKELKTISEVSTEPGKPYFVSFPEDYSISCPYGVTCSIPVSAAVAPNEPISIRLDRAASCLARGVAVGVTATRTVAPHTFGTDIAISANGSGPQRVCLKLSTLSRSVQKCFEFEIQVSDPCRDVPCKNLGTCVGQGTSFSCLCQPGYRGDRCETRVEPCESSPCQNGGTCLPLTFMKPGFSCRCPPGFSGLQCHLTRDVCASSPCWNGGKCLAVTVANLTEFVCNCPPGFVGLQCQTNVNECLFQPCANGGMCEDLVNDFKCHCRQGYTGKTCTQLTAGCQKDADCMGTNAMCFILRQSIVCRHGQCQCIPED